MELIDEAKMLLGGRAELGSVEHVGSGAWSDCFAFVEDGSHRVVRIGRHVSDFEKDRFAVRFNGPHLPVPCVHEIGSTDSGHFAISDRVFGEPLEGLKSWADVAISVVSTLEALRVAELIDDTGWGAWDVSGNASKASWTEHLLAVNADVSSQRTHGWSQKLRSHHQGQVAFDRCYALLQEVATDAVPRSVIHGDLINRNVHVADGEIAGVFDWGCSIYGDHLYDLAWLDFWAPWHGCIEPDVIRAGLEVRWGQAGHVVANFEERLLACQLHIGLDHLAYFAYLEDWTEQDRLIARIADLVDAGRVS